MAPVQTPIAPTRACPKCGQVSPVTVRECPRCQVIIDKVASVEERRRADRADRELSQQPLTARLADANRLMIRQSVERLEVFTGFETANHYTVLDEANNALFFASEESGDFAKFLGRMFLKALRPFTVQLLTSRGDPAMTIERPFRFWFHEVRVEDPVGNLLGRVEKQFSLVNRIYRVSARGQSYDLFGPLFRPWTFKILRNGVECGAIRKKWSGFTKELFTDADSFGIEFPPGIDETLKAVFLGAVFLIDFVHFEDSGGD